MSSQRTDFRARVWQELRARTNLWKYLARLRNSPRFWPRRRVRKHIGGVVFEVDIEPDLTGVAMYLGLYEPATARTMTRFLRPGDTFVDIGANIGYLSAVGANLVGRWGQVHCFEPVPRYFQRLQRLAETNPEYAIYPHQAAGVTPPARQRCARALPASARTPSSRDTRLRKRSPTRWRFPWCGWTRGSEMRD